MENHYARSGGFRRGVTVVEITTTRLKKFGNHVQPALLRVGTSRGFLAFKKQEGYAKGKRI
ncbi:MAG: hypothetical protein N2235_20130 [Fischerella sp.]|nr:hypothetical protein [Fischerella sp.]